MLRVERNVVAIKKRYANSWNFGVRLVHSGKSKRILTHKIAKEKVQRSVVDHRPETCVAIIVSITAMAIADEHALLVAPNGEFAVTLTLQAKSPDDFDR